MAESFVNESNLPQASSTPTSAVATVAIPTAPVPNLTLQHNAILEREVSCRKSGEFPVNLSTQEILQIYGN